MKIHLSTRNLNMKKILAFSFCLILVPGLLIAQKKTTEKKQQQMIDLSNRANDHILLQLGYTNWTGKPDSLMTNGLSKSINAYFMFDFPFKTNPNLSIAVGAGIASDHILFSNTYIGIKDLTSDLRFTNMSDTDHYKKTKLATNYLEAPVEFRYSAHPVTGKGLKAAIGVKVGLLVNAHTRNTKYADRNNNTINDYTLKETDKRFFNTTRISGMARIGLGHISIFGSYAFTPLLKDGSGPEMRPFSIGITLSGL